jgi:hypothetical protein
MRAKRICSFLAQIMLVSSVAINSGVLLTWSDLPVALASSRPTANAGLDQTVNEGDNVTLNGTGSSDVDEDRLTYFWNQTDGTTVTLDNATSSMASFTAPEVDSDGDVLTFELTVDDGNGGNDTDTVDIFVHVNQAPLADAGPDQTVDEGDTVTLDASASSDSDGSISSYSWLQTGGSAVTLDDSSSATPSFTAPSVDSASDTLSFEVTVTDDDDDTDTDSVDIVVNNVNQLPAVDAGEDQAVNEGDNVDLDGTGSSDPDGTIQSYSWTQTAGTSVTLDDPASPTPSFTAPSVGPSGETLTFELTVTDNDGEGATDEVDVTVQNVNQPPTAGLTANPTTINEGETSALDASGSTDPDSGDSLTYSFTILNSGPGTITGQTDANDPTATYEAPSDVSSDQTVTIQVEVDDGNGGTDTETVDIFVQDVNQAPLADAGPDQTVDEGDTVTLNGTATSDPDGDPLTYSWNQTTGTTVTLDDATSATPSFTAPDVRSSGDVLAMELTVTDSEGNTDSDSVSVSINDSAPPPNSLPISDAGSDQTVYEGDAVTLKGTGSSDPDGDPLIYSWNQTAGTSVTLDNTTSSMPSFTAPDIDSSNVTLTFELTVDDGNGASDTDIVDILVQNVNQALVADAGPDQTVTEGDNVTLNGTASNDTDGTIASYSWNQTSGTPVTLDDVTSATPSFTAPDVGSEDDILIFELTVTDNDGANSTDSVSITVTDTAPPPNSAPTADAGNDQIVSEGDNVTLNGTSSSDPDGDTLTYSWNQTAGPVVVLSNSSTANPAFTAPDVDSGGATLTFELTVDDGNGGNDTDTVDILVQNVNQALVADAGSNQSVTEGDNVTLNGTASNDTDGTIASYSWNQTSGTPVTLDNATSSMASFTAPEVDSDGDVLTFELTVDDGNGGGDTDTADVSVNNINQTPVADAGPDQTGDEGTVVTLNGTGSSDPDDYPEPLTYLWEQIDNSGFAISLSDPTSATPSFTAPEITVTNILLTFRLMVSDGASSSTDTVNITVNNLASPGYHFSPSFSATGTTYLDTPDRPALRLPLFTAAAWFKTSSFYSGNAMIVNKGGFGSESAGQNMNYGIWFNSNEKLVAGFETSSGPDMFVVSSSKYNDGIWHYAVVTFDGSNIRLYVDGTQIGSKSTTATPDIDGSQPLRIGANSNPSGNINYFIGEIDEVRVWNRAISATEISDQYNIGIFDENGLLTYMDGVMINNIAFANAGADQIALRNTLVSLDGTGSFDPDGDSLIYSWTQTAGPTVTINNANSATASLTTPDVEDSITLTFDLTVSDGKGSAVTDSVDVLVRGDNQPPVADAGSDLTVNEGTDEVMLNGTGSTDPDAGDTLSYLWTQTAGPTVSLDDPAAVNPIFTAPVVSVDTTLSFELTVSDGIANSTDSVTVAVINTAGGYSYSPAFKATGSTKYDIPHHPSLQLQFFTLATWFKTSSSFSGNVFIANKGGVGSESPGKNMNYGIWMDNLGRIEAGFELADGPDFFVRTTDSYNDGNWHYAVLTYDGSKVKVYIDGVQVAFRPFTGSPDMGGTQPLRIGANSLSNNKFFRGDIDEVRVWSRAISSVEVADQYFSGIFDIDRQLVYMDGESHNSRPFTNAGPDQIVDEGTTVTLNGTASIDPDAGDTLSYLWTQTAGPTVSLDDPAAVNPIFTAPVVAVDTTLSFDLTVSDGIANSTDSVIVTVINTAGGYTYLPSRNLDGDNYIDLLDNQTLRLSKFTVAAWFKTSSFYSGNAMIVSKGGLGTDAPGENMNYGIWMNSAEKIVAGFETAGTGADRIVTSANTYNDGNLHYAVVTFDGSVVRLYVDGVQIGTRGTTNTPETDVSHPLRIGANPNPNGNINYFIGEIDEVRVWNRAISATEMSNQYNSGLFDTSGQVVMVDMNGVPTANAGSTDMVVENTVATLDGNDSSDPNNDPLSYSWVQLTGPAVELSGADTATPSFTTPDVVGEGLLNFELTVGDGQYFATDTVKVYSIDSGIGHAILETPDYMNDLESSINNATESVYVAMFYVETYPDSKLINALEDAKNRGLDVKLIFSNHTLSQYPDTDNDLTARGIPFKVIPNHAKLVVIDNQIAYVGSANWNKNGLENNRELSIKTSNANTVSEVVQYINTLWDTGNVVVNRQEKHYERFANGDEFYNVLLTDLRNATSIKILMFAMTYNFNDPEAVDTKILNEIKFAHERGANLQIVLDDPRYYETFGGRQFLTKENIPHKLDEKNTGTLQRMHTKALLIDDEILYVGSQNWTFDALISPLEASLITRDAQTISDFQAIFDNEWTLGHFP